MLRQLAFLFAAIPALALQAADLRVKVVDQTSQGVANAVVYALPTTAPLPAVDANAAPLVIDQIDKAFINAVTVIRPGMAVIFPNHDNIRHHVYSFSPAKTFELPLYKDVTPQPVRFDTAGAVALGCNIHDWMSAYIYIVDTPFTALTDNDGMATLNLPAGDYRVGVWHQRLKNQNEPQPRSVTISTTAGPQLEYELSLKKNFKSAARIVAGGFDGGGYR